MIRRIKYNKNSSRSSIKDSQSSKDVRKIKKNEKCDDQKVMREIEVQNLEDLIVGSD